MVELTEEEVRYVMAYRHMNTICRHYVLRDSTCVLPAGHGGDVHRDNDGWEVCIECGYEPNMFAGHSNECSKT